MPKEVRRACRSWSLPMFLWLSSVTIHSRSQGAVTAFRPNRLIRYTTTGRIPRQQRQFTTTASSLLTMSGNNDDSQNVADSHTTLSTPQDKQIIFLRHSITYMNEYLGRSLRFGAPGFTDVFDDNSNYLDTPLSPAGVRLAQRALARPPAPPFLSSVDLIVTSPLRRALQTLELGILPHYDEKSRTPPPIVAHPQVAERLYLISDVGRPLAEVQAEYPNVDFSLCDKDKNWWYTPDKSHVEWRPTGKGQRYACPGEPAAHFDDRLKRFYH